MSYSDFVNETPTSALVLDKCLAVSQLISVLLNRDRRFSVVAEASDGISGLKAFKKFRPLLVITGLSLPEMNGAELIRAIRVESSATRFCIFSGTRNPELLRAGLAARPEAFVHKTETLETLRLALEATSSGASYMSPFAVRLLMDTDDHDAKKTKLSPRERTIIQLVAEGKSSKQVAGRLSISVRTVEHHRSQLMRKLCLPDVTAITRYAANQGMISL